MNANKMPGSGDSMSAALGTAGAQAAQVAALNKMTGLRAFAYDVDTTDFVTIRFQAITFDPTQLTPERLQRAAAVSNARHVAIELFDLDKVERVAITAAELDPLQTAKDYPGIPVGPCFAKLWPVRVGEALVRVLS